MKDQSFDYIKPKLELFTDEKNMFEKSTINI